MALAAVLTAPTAHAAKEKKMASPMFATFKTSLGDIVVKLLPEKAPKTVENFVALAEGTKEWKDPHGGQMVKKPLYDGTVFHRVIPQFMIQGGDPLGNGTGGPGYKFADEIGPDNKFSKPGLLAMANAGPNTNGSQFFITEVPTPWLDKGHTIFGEVVKGFELVPKIAAAGNAKVKLEKVVITRGAQP
jgi:peptidyl-prolyl cis-trans isomerase A (cyclophilin A)